MIPRTFYSFKTVVSTQDIARAKALTGEPGGSVIMADFQTGGRGRQGRGWFAPPGANVCMTVIWEAVRADEAWQIALVAGVATAEGIREAIPTIHPRLRFPNDIQLDGRKLGGILVETVPHPQIPRHVIPLIGIGVNGNIPEVVFPEDLRVRAISLLSATGETQSVATLAGLIVRRLCDLWGCSFAGDLLPRWRALRDPDATRPFRFDDRIEVCRALDIAPDGTVILESVNSGERREIPASLVILGDE